MPREHVYGESLAVTDGELAVLAARRLDDLTQLVLPAPGGGRPLVPLTVGGPPVVDHGARRRRLDVLEAFAAAVRGIVDAAPTDDPAERVERASRRAAAWAELRDLRRELDDQLAATEDPDPDAAPAPPTVGPPTGGEDGDALDVVVVRRRATLAWTRDAGLVTLRVDGYSHTRATDVDLGGVLLPLDWAGCNRLARKLVVARDQSWGAPA